LNKQRNRTFSRVATIASHAGMVEINARKDAGRNHHDLMNNNMKITRDFEAYNAVYQNSYGPTNKAYSAGYQHNCCNQCNGAGIVVLIVSAVAGFLISWVMTDGVRLEWNKHHNEFKYEITDADVKNGDAVWPEKYTPEEGDRIYGEKDYEKGFWNWVIAGAGALLSLGIATTCLHCCAKSKNRIEAKHNVVGAELAGMLTENGKLAPHGVVIRQEDRDFGGPINQPFPPTKGGFNGAGNPYVHPMRNPPLSQPAMSQPPMNHPPMGQPSMNQPPMGQPSMNQPPMGQPPMNQPQFRAIMPQNQPSMQHKRSSDGNVSDQPNLYVGPIDESTKKYKKGMVIVHKPQVRESIVGYEKTEIPLAEYSRKSNRRHKSRRTQDSDLSDY